MMSATVHMAVVPAAGSTVRPCAPRRKPAPALDCFRTSPAETIAQQLNTSLRAPWKSGMTSAILG